MKSYQQYLYTHSHRHIKQSPDHETFQSSLLMTTFISQFTNNDIYIHYMHSISISFVFLYGLVDYYVALLVGFFAPAHKHIQKWERERQREKTMKHPYYLLIICKKRRRRKNCIVCHTFRKFVCVLTHVYFIFFLEKKKRITHICQLPFILASLTTHKRKHKHSILVWYGSISVNRKYCIWYIMTIFKIIQKFQKSFVLVWHVTDAICMHSTTKIQWIFLHGISIIHFECFNLTIFLCVEHSNNIIKIKYAFISVHMCVCVCA